MKFLFLFGVCICFFILMYDGCQGQIDREEKVVYLLICAFFCGMFTPELLISYLRERAIRKLFGDSAKDLV